MIIHLHEYEKDCVEDICPYCSYHLIRNAKICPKLEDNLRVSMINKTSDHAEEIRKSISLFAIEGREKILVTNIATNTFNRLEPIFNWLADQTHDLTIRSNIMIKKIDENFSTRNTDCHKKSAWVSFRDGYEGHELHEFDHIVFIDDVYNTGCSYELAKLKFCEIGVLSKKISLITILKINQVNAKVEQLSGREIWNSVRDQSFSDE
jgi:hypothetical protein